MLTAAGGGSSPLCQKTPQRSACPSFSEKQRQKRAGFGGFSPLVFCLAGATSAPTLPSGSGGNDPSEGAVHPSGGGLQLFEHSQRWTLQRGRTGAKRWSSRLASSWGLGGVEPRAALRGSFSPRVSFLRARGLCLSVE